MVVSCMPLLNHIYVNKWIEVNLEIFLYYVNRITHYWNKLVRVGLINLFKSECTNLYFAWRSVGVCGGCAWMSLHKVVHWSVDKWSSRRELVLMCLHRVTHRTFVQLVLIDLYGFDPPSAYVEWLCIPLSRVLEDVVLDWSFSPLDFPFLCLGWILYGYLF